MPLASCRCPSLAGVLPPSKKHHPADNTKLTRREASHFIATTIVAEEDGSEEEEERGLEGGIEDIASPGPPFIAKGGVL